MRSPDRFSLDNVLSLPPSSKWYRLIFEFEKEKAGPSQEYPACKGSSFLKEE